MLSRDFRRALGDEHSSEVIECPHQKALGYDGLEPLVRHRLEELDDPTLLIGESFSGPLAVRVAADPPPAVVGLVLVATFVEPPRSSALRHLITPVLFRLPPPRMVIRRYLVGNDAPDVLVRAVVEAVRRVSPSVMSCRVKAVLGVDERAALRRVPLPILFIEAGRDRVVIRRRALGQCRPDIDLRTIDSPHLVLQRKPREAAEVVREFAERMSVVV